MSVLKNSRHERFAQAVVAGKSHRAAYVVAGYAATGPAADACATKLLRNAQVAARIAELTEAAANASSIAAGRVLDEMGAIALANVLDYVTIGADGLPRIDFSGMTRKQAAALVEITVDHFTDGAGDEARPVRRVRFKLGEKFGALVKLGQGLGLFKDRVRLEGKVEVESKQLTDIEAARQIAFLLHQAMNAPTPEAKP